MVTANDQALFARLLAFKKLKVSLAGEPMTFQDLCERLNLKRNGRFPQDPYMARDVLVKWAGNQPEWNSLLLKGLDNATVGLRM